MSTEAEATRVKLLEAMLSYLEQRHTNQLAYFAQIDAKVTVKLTVCAGLVVVVGFLLPKDPKPELGLLWWETVGAIGVFVLCLGRTLWLALHSVDIRVALPAVQGQSFRDLAARETPAVVDCLRSLVGCYVSALESNNEIFEQRKLHGDALNRWSAATLLVSFVVVVLLMALYIFG